MEEVLDYLEGDFECVLCGAKRMLDDMANAAVIGFARDSHVGHVLPKKGVCLRCKAKQLALAAP